MALRILSKHRLAGLLVSSSLVALSMATGGVFNAALAQSLPALPSQSSDSQAPFLLTANELVYNHDSQKIMAIGGVQIAYNGYRMVAQQIEYDQASGRLIASGKVEIVDSSGNKMHADRIDVTDDFANGFADSISMRTADNVAIAGQKAERLDGNKMIVDKGIYTACVPCSETPDKPPLWQIRAERVIQDGVTHTVRLEHPSFEIFGKPIALLPSISVPDGTVKRKAGFLFPSINSSSNLGISYSQPYYLPLTPSSDVTFTGTGYTQQGFMLEAEYRQRYANGTHTLRLAGISQANPDSFDSGTADQSVENRGFIASKGSFSINPRWVFGWDVMAQSDNDFANTYSISGYDDDTFNNQVYLQGLGKRNSFSVTANYFDVQDADTHDASEKKQATALPTIDYQYYAPEPVYGGELSVTSNLTNINRRESDIDNTSVNTRFLGLEGDNARLTTEVQWQKTLIGPAGLVMTPLLALRADGNYMDVTNPNDVSNVTYPYAGNFNNSNTAARGLATAGLEVRYPWLLTDGSNSNIIEPIAQIYVRNNEQYAGELTNEDAQSLVFDYTNLFSRDKFSGYDREEGGTRANVGFRYTGSFQDGILVNGAFGQSYQLAGLNSYATDDLTGVGIDSGLEDDVSDFVGGASVSFPQGISLNAGARLDKDSLALNRTDAGLAFDGDWLATAFAYSAVDAQPGYAYETSSREIKSTGKVKLDSNWSVSGSFTWDLENNVMTRRWFGLTYEDICTSFSIVYRQKWDTSNASAATWQIGAQLTLRTLGDIGYGSTDGDNFN
ncbi:LPS-assembly protein LptD [Martelella sp. HB161492]|uniref:LPS-assembly protein LptD n=1 Tax=Martelella sp. HB161492 TaxID=2720726 RepID=UPI0032B20E29